MRIRPGRVRSLISGIAVLVITGVGVVLMMTPQGLMRGMPGMGSTLGIFQIVWVAFGLLGAGVAFYNAFSRRGVPLYEIEAEQETEKSTDGGVHCPRCGKPVDKRDKFCRTCGAYLRN